MTAYRCDDSSSHLQYADIGYAAWLSERPEREKAAALDGYYAYFGTYEMDIGAGTITHHVIGSLRPNEVGSKLTRQVRLERGRLTLTTPPFNQEGEQRFNRLVWERVK
jgi:hypothetical protein